MFTKKEEKLFMKWWVNTGFDTDFISEEKLRKIWAEAFDQGYAQCYRRMRKRKA